MGSLEHAKTELFNLSTRKWKKSSSYFNYEQIYSFAVCFYSDRFYIIGGKTKNDVLSFIAIFNPKTEEWKRVGKLKFPRVDHKVHVIDDKLFIIGGSEFPEYCNLVDFSCSMYTDATFNRENNPILYAFYPSNCKLGIFSNFKVKLFLL